MAKDQEGFNQAAGSCDETLDRPPGDESDVGRRSGDHEHRSSYQMAYQPSAINATAINSTTRTSRARFRAVARALASVALCAGVFASPAVASASANKVIAFTGHYTGKAALLINNGNVTISSVKGTGMGTLVGASSVLGRGAASAAAQCDPFTGTGSITGAGGKIALVVTKSTGTQGCSNGESGPITVTFQGVAKATGGTGKTEDASGSLKFHGTLKLGNTSGAQTGSFSVTLTGKLSVK